MAELRTLTRRGLLSLAAGWPAAYAATLAAEWRRMASGTDGVVGVAAMNLGSGQHLSLRGDDRFPMASVCKLPIAMQILALVDAGKLSLRSRIEVLPADVTLSYSDIGHRWARQKQFPLDELLELMIARSDNTAVETLYRIGGGAPAIMTRLRGWGLDGIRIDRTEKQCGLDAGRDMRAFIADPRDTATPDGTVHLLARLFRGELLAAASTAHLIRIMESTATGPGRIKGLLPPGTVVAHKTGTAGTRGGLNGGTNDVGVITLPQGAGQLALAIYVKGSTHSLPQREAVIARIARAAFDSARLE
ncbi:MAG TPA: class A beta-lactamase [Bryobacteraceae bacterium]|nr:class A beta-lactamase [Bryobacteraceae bacterium]